MLDPQTLKQRIIFRRLIQILVIAAIFLMALTPINTENDIYWQLKLGEDIARYHHFPVNDPYSLPANGDVWTLHEWLPSVAFYLINQQFGSPGLIIFKAIIVASTFIFFLLLFNRLKTNLYLSVLFLAMAVWINTRGIWMVFPSIFEYLFLASVLYLLEVYRQERYRFIPVALGVLSLIWVNSHGSFFLLPGITGAYLLGDWLVEKLKNYWSGYQPSGLPLGKTGRGMLLAVFLFSLMAPIFTPNGIYESYYYPFKISLGKFTPYVNEYQHFWEVWHGDWSDFVHGFAYLLMWSLLALAVFCRRRLHPTDIILGLSFWFLAMIAVRHVAVFALVALLLLVRYLGLWFGEYRGCFKRTLVKDILIMAMIVLMTTYYKNRVAPFGLSWSETIFPKEAAELIYNNHVKGNMFNHYNYGGYLIWKMSGYKVFMDGRLEMYQGQAGDDYLTIIDAKAGYKKLLDKYKINFFILYLADNLVRYLVNDPAWKYVYHDNQYVVFVKNSPENSSFLARYWSLPQQENFKKDYGLALQNYWSQLQNREGVIAADRADLAAAQVAFEKSIKYDPTSIQSRLNLAQVLLSLRKPDEAKKEYEFILNNLDKQNPVAESGLAAVKKFYDSFGN